MLQTITLRYDAVEDRIVMRLAGGGPSQDEIWLQLTRRLCQSLRSELQTLATASAQVPDRLGESAKAAVTAMHHQTQADQVPVRKDPRPLPQAPTNAALVIGLATGRLRQDGRWVLRLDLRDQPPVHVTLTDQTLHGVIRLLNQQAVAAQWGLPEMQIESKPAPIALSEASRDYH